MMPVRHELPSPAITTRWLLAWVACFHISAAAAYADESLKSYRVDTGDAISVFVLGEDDLSIQATINNEGTIFYPLLGEIRLAGLTESEIETLITDRLKGPYLIDPRVSVTIVGYRKFFVEGAVASPGGYSYTPGLTAHQAITVAGGFTERASRRKVYVVHENETFDQRLRVDLGTLIQPGDTITVEESFF